ncbi:MAG: putative RNA-binding protein with PIN domain [Ilumatobacter sp.]|jgi:predicted RNA-binding protein with PIN domain
MTEIEHRHLRSALEFAVLIAAEGQKRRPPLPYPKELKSSLTRQRLAASALGKVRRAIEADPKFRSSISTGALPELVDEVGVLWLDASEGWEAKAATIIAERSESEASVDLARDLKRAEKRRGSAEQAAARSQAALIHRDATIATNALEVDELQAEVAKLADEITELRAELVDTRNEIRHARDRERAAVAKAEPKPNPVAPVMAVEPVPHVKPVAPTAPSLETRWVIDAQRRLAEAAAASREFAEHIESLLGEVGSPESAGRSSRPAQRGVRTPMELPGGVIATSAAAAQYLVRSGEAVFVDGYNVAKLAWPDRNLEQQRDALVDRVENMVRRHGTHITIVFDGSSVVGAHASGRRLARVVYSPEGVTADDVIRSEVEWLPIDKQVVVVTNDREIVRDVRAAGANVIPSNAFIAAL